MCYVKYFNIMYIISKFSLRKPINYKYYVIYLTKLGYYKEDWLGLFIKYVKLTQFKID